MAHQLPLPLAFRAPHDVSRCRARRAAARLLHRTKQFRCSTCEAEAHRHMRAVLAHEGPAGVLRLRARQPHLAVDLDHRAAGKRPQGTA